MNDFRYLLVSVMAFAAVFALGATSAWAQVRISIWHYVSPGSPAGAAFQEILEDFRKKNPDIEVEEVYGGGSGKLAEKVQVALASGAAPNVEMVSMVHVLPHVLINGLVPLNEPYISHVAPEFLTNFP